MRSIIAAKLSLAGMPIDVTLGHFALLSLPALWPGRGLLPAAILAAAFASAIFTHELSHALTARRFKLSPRILLNALGGRCICSRRATTAREEMMVVLAGPLASTLVALAATGAAALVPREGSQWAQVLDLVGRANTVLAFVSLLPLHPMDGARLLQLGLRQTMSRERAAKMSRLGGSALVLLGALAVWVFFEALQLAVPAAVVAAASALARSGLEEL